MVADGRQIPGASGKTPPVPICTARSHPAPLPGQKRRSSSDVSTAGAPSGVSRLRFTCPRGISFNVMCNMNGGTDPVVWAGLTNGSQMPFQRLTNIYISDPAGARLSFDVDMWPS
jgi:hypothetical protein